MSDVHAGYDAIGDECLGGAQPGTVALQDACEERFATTSDGIYNCRNVRGGTTKSAHAEGRAVDVHWTVEESGRRIADLLVTHNAELGIQCVIWWDRIWSYEVGHWHDYHGADRHRGHLHVEQNWSGAKHLSRRVADVILAAHIEQPAPPAPQVQEDEDMSHRYGDKTGGDKSQVLVDGPIAVIIKHGDSAEALDAGNVKTILINPGDYADIKAQASNK